MNLAHDGEASKFAYRYLLPGLRVRADRRNVLAILAPESAEIGGCYWCCCLRFSFPCPELQITVSTCTFSPVITYTRFNQVKSRTVRRTSSDLGFAEIRSNSSVGNLPHSETSINVTRLENDK